MSKPARSSEMDSLIALLDDPSEVVQHAIRARFDALGHKAVVYLRQAQQQAAPPHRVHIAEMAHALHIADIEEAWGVLMAASPTDLEHGAFLIARYRYPELDQAAYRAELDAFATRLRTRLKRARGFERIRIVSTFFFEELRFRGNHEAYYDPENSYLNRVLDRRLGIPITLAVVYMLLCRRLDLPVYGVNMPAHFLVKYDDGTDEIFLDLFKGGVPFRREAAVRSLLKAGLKPHPTYFNAAQDDAILLRIVRNLVLIAQENHLHPMVSDLQRLLEPWEADLI